MGNQLIIERFKAIRQILLNAHGGGRGHANAMIGSERESFINLILSNVVAPPFRVGTGEITDVNGNRSGQVDVVIEYTNTISVPLLQGNSARLYLAEGVCCVIEVKSNLDKQWASVAKKARTISRLERELHASYRGENPTSKIPVFAVGFKGGKNVEKWKNRLEEVSCLSGILILDAGIYIDVNQEYGGSGAASIFEFLRRTQTLTSSVLQSYPNYRPYMA